FSVSRPLRRNLAKETSSSATRSLICLARSRSPFAALVHVGPQASANLDAPASTEMGTHRPGGPAQSQPWPGSRAGSRANFAQGFLGGGGPFTLGGTPGGSVIASDAAVAAETTTTSTRRFNCRPA